MLRFKSSLVLTGVTALLAASALFAQDKSLVDNLEDGNNANEFENYWYYYDDNSGVKKDDRPQAATPGKASVVNVVSVDKNREAFGDPKDTYKVKDYTFTTKVESGNTFATMPFTFGEKWIASWCEKKACAFPFVGIGTMLAPDGASLDITGATEVSFKLRSHTNALSLWFKIETQNIAKDSTFAFYQASVQTTAGAWTEHKIVIADLLQPAWAKPDRVADFDIKLAQKLSWGCSMEDNTTVTSDTLDVDEVYITGYKYVSPTVWTKVETAQPTTGRFSQFEAAPKHASPIGTYWYAYADGEIGGNSQVTQGAAVDPANPTRFTLDIDVAGSGADNSFGAFIKGTCGKTVKQTTATGTADVQGFLGIGVNVYDSSKNIYWNNVTAKYSTMDLVAPATGIYFEYNCAGDFKYLTLEVSDSNDVGDQLHPTRKDKRGSGVVWYRNFPNTNGAWKKVLIPFDSLITHKDWKGYVAIPLDKSAIAKVQWKTQNGENKAGMIAVDNVFFPSADFKVPPAAAKYSFSRQTAASAFSAAYTSGKIQINWTNTSNVTGSINLINTKGAVVATVPVSASTIAAAKLPAGLYFVQLNGSANGKAVSHQTAVSIVK